MKSLLGIFLALHCIPHIPTQAVVEEPPVYINRIAARVNEQVILASEVEELYQQIVQSKEGGESPSKDALLQLLIENKLLYIKAKEQKIVATPEEESQALNDLLKRMGNEDLLVRSFGKPIEEIKNEFRPRIEEQLTVNKMQAHILKTVEATPEKVKQFFTALPIAKRPYFSAEVMVRQIVKYVPTQEDPDGTKTKNYLTKLREHILSDKLTFVKAAKIHSEDLSTSMHGGLLHLGSGPGMRVLMDELPTEIYFAIDTLRVGEISLPQRFMTDNQREVFKLFFIEQKIPPHRANLTQDYHKIEQLYLNEMRTNALKTWLKCTREEVDISVADDYQVGQATQ